MDKLIEYRSVNSSNKWGIECVFLRNLGGCLDAGAFEGGVCLEH